MAPLILNLNGLLHALAALSRGKKNLVTNEKEAGWGLKPIWTFRREKHFLTLSGKQKRTPPPIVPPVT